MSLVDLMQSHKVRHVDDSTRELVSGDTTLSTSRNNPMKIHAVWPAHSHYGLSAFVVSNFGHVDIVSLDGYGNEKVSQSLFNGMVKHLGETAHGFPKRVEQIIEVRFIDRIRIVVPIIHTKYLGKQNYALDANIKIRVANDKGLDVSMDTMPKPNSHQTYNYSPCIIHNGPDGLIMHSWEKYSEPATIFAPIYDMEQHEFRLETQPV